MYCLFEKTENKQKRGRDWPIFFKKMNVFFIEEHQWWWEQCKRVRWCRWWAVWLDLVKFRHFGNILSLWRLCEGLFSVGQKLSLLWSTFYAIGQIFIAANGLILTNNLAIWWHWRWANWNIPNRQNDLKVTETRQTQGEREKRKR